jgi:hypothetical protein
MDSLILKTNLSQVNIYCIFTRWFWVNKMRTSQHWYPDLMPWVNDGWTPNFFPQISFGFPLTLWISRVKSWWVPARCHWVLGETFEKACQLFTLCNASSRNTRKSQVGFYLPKYIGAGSPWPWFNLLMRHLWCLETTKIIFRVLP